MSQLRAERQALQASIDLLASHGGRADITTCGAALDLRDSRILIS